VIISQWSECWLWQVKGAADLFGALVIVIEGFLLWVELSIETLQFTIHINTWVCFVYTSLPFSSRSSHHQEMLLNTCLHGLVLVKLKVKIIPWYAYAGTEGRQRYSSKLFTTRRGWVVSTTPWPLHHQEDPTSIAQEGRWALGPTWTSVENFPPLWFNPQAVKVIMSGYTAYTNPATISQTVVSQT